MDLRSVVHRLGGNLYDGGSRALVPGPGHSRGDRSLSLYDTGERIVWHSYANDPTPAIRDYLGITSEAESDLSKSQRAAMKQKRREWEILERHRKLEFCKDIWGAAIPATGTPAHKYLLSRSVSLIKTPPVLRYLDACPRSYKKTDTSPAMVALVSDHHGNPCGLHMTFLGASGHTGRIMAGALRGGAVRLHQATTDLAIAEGIETALSYAEMHAAPTWAVLSTSGLLNFIPPTSVDHLTLAIDSDDTSKTHMRGAALEIAETKAYPWCQTTIHAAPAGQDWNDALRAQP